MSAAGQLPAFPYSTPPTHRDGLGLTKRELFAAMAPAYPFKMPQVPLNDKLGPLEHVSATLVKWNVAWADAIIAELAKDKT